MEYSGYFQFNDSQGPHSYPLSKDDLRIIKYALDAGNELRVIFQAFTDNYDADLIRLIETKG